jgi:hypothetical protein
MYPLRNQCVFLGASTVIVQFRDIPSFLFAPAAEGVLEAVPVSARVNHIDQDDEGLLIADGARA